MNDVGGSDAVAMTENEPETILAFEDHLSYVHRSPVHLQNGLVPNVRGLSDAHRAFVERHGLTAHGYLQSLPAGDPGNAGSQGISHALMAERYALPGQLIAGTDSHTPHSGALGCVAFGVGGGPWPQGAAQCKAVPAVRHGRRARLLHRARLSDSVRGGRRENPAAGMRRVRELRAGLIDRCGSGHDQRDQSQFYRPLGTGAGVAGESADGRCQRHCGEDRVVRGAAGGSRWHR